MNNLIYSFRDSNVRIVVKDNEPWFVMKDICEILDIKNPRDAYSRLEEEEKGVGTIDTKGGIQDLNVINEYGLYSLVFTSRKPEAREFKNWVTRIVLPSIRKNGVYATDDVIKKTLDDPQYMIDILTRLKEEKEQRLAAENRILTLQHTDKTYTATEIAKELGFSSAIEFNNWLSNKGVQYKVNKTWVMYSKYAKLGYTEIKQQVLDHGKVVYHTKFTQDGREFILNLYKGDK